MGFYVFFWFSLVNQVPDEFDSLKNFIEICDVPKSMRNEPSFRFFKKLTDYITFISFSRIDFGMFYVQEICFS